MSPYLYWCIFLAILAGTVVPECPIGWFHYESSCFMLSHEKLNWFNAQASCRGNDSRLAEINDVHTMDFLSYLLNITIAPNKDVNGVWVGGRDDVVEGQWQWASTKQDFEYTNWAPGEPRDGVHGNCLQLYKHFAWQFDDYFCTNAELYICESKIPRMGAEIIG